MPQEYIPKTPVLSPLRIQRIAKKLIEEAAEDRKLALETHRFFRQMVAENEQDSTAKNLMVDCLKVAQASKNNVIKALNLVIKMQEEAPELTKASGKASGSSIFSQLDSLVNE